MAITTSLLYPSGNIAVITPTFQGLSLLGDVMDMVNIEVRRSSDSASMWASGNIAVSPASVLFNVNYAGSALAGSTSYQWRARIRANSDHTTWSAWTSWLAFTTAVNHAPAAVNVSPTAGASPGTLTPTMIGQFTDVDSFSTFAAAQIQVRRVSDSLAFWDSGQLPTTVAEQAAKQFSRTYAGTALVNATAYEWRCRVEDDGGLWSNYTSWTAFTPALHPNPPTALTPSGLANTLTPAISGTYNQGSGGTEDFFQYEIKQGTITIYQSGDVAADIATGQAYGTNNPSDTPATPPALAWGTQYYIRARSKDNAAAYSDWSAWQTFNTNAAPTTPTNLSPAANSTTGDTTPRISWTHNDADSDAQTAVDIELRDVLTDTVVGTYSPKTLAQATLFHDVTDVLTDTPATQYKYRVRTKGLAGPGYGPWSAWIVFTVTTAPVVAVTSPAAGATITAPALAVTWTFSGGSGTEQDWRVYIYGSDGITVLHDSGVTAGIGLTYTLPVGVLENIGAYFVRVVVRDTLSQSADSGLIAFSTAWTPPATLTGLVLTVVNTPPGALPYDYLNWDESGVSVSDFISYYVYRKLSSDSAWTQIAQINDRAITYYQDYLVGGGVSWDYAVTQVEDISGENVESDKAIVGGLNDFTCAYIHDVVSPAYFAELFLETSTFIPEQEHGLVQPWAQQAPTMHIGAKEATRISIRATHRQATYDALRTLFTRQRTAGSVFCYRSYRGDRYFVNIEVPRRDDQLSDGVDIQLELQEVFFSESVA